MSEYGIDYDSLFSIVKAENNERKIDFLTEQLPYEWRAQYLRMTPHTTNILHYRFNDFTYIYDAYAMLETTVEVPVIDSIESRVVGVLGRSNPNGKKREIARQRGWVGQTEKYFGKFTDKGHFMANSIGGGLEVNMFAQRRDINRGWSDSGRVFRSMERYCFQYPGTFCFNRPIYTDVSSRPSFFDFGVLRDDGDLWVEQFEN